MLFLDEIRKVPKETPVSADQRNRLKRVFKERRRRSPMNRQEDDRKSKHYMGRICRIDEQA
ncbi:MAG: hypothetical protein H8E32_09780 [Nitrospinae bacterium]|nr:hypothetical protein [Nitrospinota bacterium]